MRVLVQKSKEAKCTVDNQVVGEIDNGMMLLVGFTEGDDIEKIKYMVNKVINLRIYEDENKVMNRNILTEPNASILSISQFTLYADTKKGNRPSYIKALSGEKAELLYHQFNEELSKHIKVETGKFGSDMQISFTNDGPVTILLER